MLAEQGLRVPDDMSVIAFDDSEWLSFWQPPITTVDIAVEEMALLAVQLLLRRMPGGKAGRKTGHLPVKCQPGRAAILPQNTNSTGRDTRSVDRMLTMPGISTHLGYFGTGADRYNTDGYRARTNANERIVLAAATDGLGAVELHYPMMFKDLSVGEIGRRCTRTNSPVPSCRAACGMRPAGAWAR